MRNDQKPCKPGHVLQSGRFPTAPGLFTTDPARHTRLIWCEMPPQPVQGDESKLVIVVNEKKLLDVGYEEECWSWEDLDDSSDS